jgi:hypothetical protein
MPTVSDPARGRGRRPLDCRDCGSRLAVDQRYCVVCGTRARRLPSHVARTLAAIALGQRRPEVTAPAPAPAPRRRRGWLALPAFELPTPRAAAASVLGLLAFGVALGSGAASLASPPLTLLVNHFGSGGPVIASVQPVPNTSSGGGSVSSGPASSSSPSGGGGSTAASVPASSGNTGTNTTTTPASTTPLPPIKHVWVVTMGTQSYSKSFSTGLGDKYLSKTLAAKGEIVAQYYGVTQGELANEIAMISGQGPTPQTQAGCDTFSAIKPGTVAKRFSQVSGQGCVYPKQTRTLVSELAAKHHTWKAYVQGLGAVVKLPRLPKESQATAGTTTTSTARTTTSTARAAHAAHHGGIKRVGTANAATCRHPALGSVDRFQSASAADQYTTWRDPFIYFRSVTKSKACNDDVVGLTSLTDDLKSAGTTPTVSFIYPDACHDGSGHACHRGAASGMRPADKILKSIVPAIMKSAAYKQGGLILITFAQAPQTGADADTNSCCNNPTTYPNLASGGTASATSTTPTTTTPGTTTTPTGTDTTTTPTGTTTTPTTPATGCSPPGTGSTQTTTTTTTTTPTTTTPTGTDTTTTPTGTDTTTTPTGTDTTTTPTGTDTTTTPTGTTTTPSTTLPTCTAPAGGQIGLLAISQYINPGSGDFIDSFNHFSLLGSIEQLFGLKRLGYAADRQLPLFGASFYTNYTPA